MGFGADGVQRGVGGLIDAAVLPLLAHHLVLQPLVMGQAHQFVQRVLAHLGILHDLLQHFFIVGLHTKSPLCTFGVHCQYVHKGVILFGLQALLCQ